MMGTFAQVGSLFVAPWLAAAGAALVGVPIAIHLLSRFRRKRQTWGAMRFVWEAYRRHRRRLQMEQWLLLAVRCLMVVVLGLALAGPVLTGCTQQLEALGLVQGGTRSIHLVIDDSLSTQAAGSAADRRFDALRGMALRLAGAAGPGDDIVIWTASGRGEAGSASSGEGAPSGVSEAKARLEALEPGFGAAPMSGVAARVAEAVGASGASASGRPIVVLISDWSRSCVDPQRAAPSLAGARVLVSPPLPTAVNVQVASASPRRPVVVAEPNGGASVPIAVRLRRFGAAEAADAGHLRVELLDGRGREFASSQRSISFPAGQSLLTMHETLALKPETIAGAGGRQPLQLRIGIEPSVQLADALAADDVRYAAIELRPHLRIGLMQEAGAAAIAGAGDGGSALSARRWLSLALAPRLDLGARPMQLSPLTAADLAAADAPWRDLDVVMVTRPDALAPAAWSHLAGFARAGGLVWLMTPADQPSAMWARSLRDAFELDWQVAIEPMNVGDADRGLSLVLDDAPPALSMLSADWEALLRPLRVYRWLPLWAPRADAWMSLDLATAAAPGAGSASGGGRASSAAAGGGASTPALLAFHETGRGGVLLLSAALDVGWTNLPTKPAFVPLLHEALRGVAGRSPLPAMRVDQFAAQDDGDWSPLTSPTGEGEGEDGGVAAGARPGIYRDPDAAHLLAVNVDADEGDTRALDEAALAAWLDQLGPWRFLDPSDPAAALREGGGAAPNVGWSLLWALLALVLIETVLARTLSHAAAEPRPGLATAVLQRLRRLHLARPGDHRRAA